MLKKVLSVVLVLVTILSLTITANAQTTNSVAASETSTVQPRYSYTSNTSVGLDINDGIALCWADLCGYSGTTTQIKIKMTLQKKTLFWWNDVETDSLTVNDYTATLYNEIAVGSGTYRVKAEFTVYCGSDYEEITSYSQEYKY